MSTTEKLTFNSKMKLFIHLLIFALTVNIGVAQKPKIIVDIPTQEKPWSSMDLNNSQESFQFAIVTDRTGGHRPGVFLDGIKKLNLLQPEFVLSVGDLIEGYTEDVDELDAQWTEFNGFIDSLSVPFFYLPGNHDITNKVMETKWKELFGVTYYHFVYKDVLFLCLNSEDNYRGAGRGTIDDKQYKYIQKVLKENKDVKWTLVFLHQPLWIQENTKRWQDVEKLLKGRNHNVFAGHYHRYWKTDRNNGKYIALATTGGSSRLRGIPYGEFDHVVWVTMTEEGPILANLLLNGIWNENVVTEDMMKLVREKPYPVRIEPVYLKKVDINPIKTEVRITNDSDYRMRVKLEGIAHPDIYYNLEESNLLLEPNSVQKFDLELKNERDVDISIIPPVKVLAKVNYESDDERKADIELSTTLYFTPFLRSQIGEVISDIVIDGDLSDWEGNWISLSPENVSGSPFHFEGESDCDIKFLTSYDSKNFYLSFDIKDDEIYVDENAPAWNQDVLIVDLDPRPLHISQLNKGNGRNKYWHSFMQTFKQENAVHNAESMPKGMTSKVVRTEDGAHVEIVVPVEYLNAAHGDNWNSLRLGVKYYDYDKSGQHRTEHYWYPSWNSKESIPGSGMLFRQDD